MSKQILTLSGWTQPAETVRVALGLHAEIFDYSDYTRLETALEALEKFADIPHVVAWSMGGLLTVRAMQAGVLNPSHVTLIAPPYQFVNDDDFKAGMDPVVYDQFRENYATNAPRSKERFHGLIAKGDVRHKEIVAVLKHHHDVENTARWLPWLDDLAVYSHRHAAVPLEAKIQLIQGENDVIVPAGQARAWHAHYPQFNVHFWGDVGHAPHLHDADRVRELILQHHGQIL